MAACRATLVLLAWLAPLAALPGAAPPGPPARLDFHGRPLPPGALTRLGRPPFRHGPEVTNVAFSADGKLLVTTNGAGIRFWDLRTGRLLRELRGGDVLRFAPSPDSRVLGVLYKDGTIRLLDPATGREVRRLEGGEDAFSLAVAPGGKALAVGGLRKVWLCDLASGKRQAFAPATHTGLVLRLNFSADGKRLASACGGEVAVVWDVALRSVVRRLKSELIAWGPRGQVVTREEANQACVHDLAAGKEVRRFVACPPPWSQLPGGVSELILSPDGQALAAVTARGMIHFREVATGKEWFACPGEGGAFSPDGRSFAMMTGPEVIVLNVSAGEGSFALATHAGAVLAVAFTPDGKAIHTASREQRVRTWRAASGAPMRMGEPFPVAKPFCLGPRAVAGGLTTEGSLGSRDVDRGEFKWADFDRPNRVEVLAFSPDGRLLAAGDARGVQLWDVSRQVKGKVLQDGSGGGGSSRGLAFSADGRAIAVARDFFLQGAEVWAVETGKSLGRIGQFSLEEGGDYLWGKNGLRGLQVSAGGEVLALLGKTSIRLWNVRDKRQRKLAGPRDGRCLALSPDDRLLAVGEADGAVRLWEVNTGKEVECWQGHDGAVLALAFSPDGSALASGGADHTALVWAVAGARLRPCKPLGAAELERLWADLVGADAARAHQAIGALAGAPAQSVPFLARRLRPAPADGGRVARLIRELGDDDFAVRQQAEEELAQLGRATELPLRRALARKPELEQQLRLKRLLDKLPWAPAAGEELRAQRAIAALEQAGGPQARRLLKSLALGAPGAWRTLWARAALSRLDRLR